jgi:hypothetical protein
MCVAVPRPGQSISSTQVFGAFRRTKVAGGLPWKFLRGATLLARQKLPDEAVVGVSIQT